MVEGRKDRLQDTIQVSEEGCLKFVECEESLGHIGRMLPKNMSLEPTREVLAGDRQSHHQQGSLRQCDWSETNHERGSKVSPVFKDRKPEGSRNTDCTSVFDCSLSTNILKTSSPKIAPRASLISPLLPPPVTLLQAPKVTMPSYSSLSPHYLAKDWAPLVAPK
jgi:hypothetical protein